MEEREMMRDRGEGEVERRRTRYKEGGGVWGRRYGKGGPTVIA